MNYLDDGRITGSRISSYISSAWTYDTKNLLAGLSCGGYNKTANDPVKYYRLYNFTYDVFGNTASISVCQSWGNQGDGQSADGSLC